MPWSLYPKNTSPTLDPQLFANPTPEYRGTPFWSWNNRLDIPQLLRQIEELKAMGFGGGHMHARTGLDTPYLSEDFLAAVRACVAKFKSLNMLAWLYDEDRWPSGFAGGLVTSDPRFRARYLLWTCRPYGTAGEAVASPWKASGTRQENGTLIARYEVVLKEGCLAKYRRLKDGQRAARNAQEWLAYMEIQGDRAWFNNQAYVDTLSRPAIEKFVAVTHERFRQAVGADFGTTIPAIFTDEPQFIHKTFFETPADPRDLIMPWTDDLPATYQAAWNEDLLAKLPELFWELPRGKASATRYRYHEHVAERFAAAFADTIGGWCRKNGLALTGHMMAEENLRSQTAWLGEAMRSFRGFDLPGIDLLCDGVEYTTAKQAQSAAHQFGAPGVMSELYGVTNWDFDFVGHKAQGDWQAALGITVRVPHLAWVSMAGEAKRDYPAAIGYQSPWYREYTFIEDHFARVNTVLTRGQPVVRIGLIHPIESYWLAWGPLDQTRLARQEAEENFQQVTEWLVQAQFDFDYVCEALLPAQSPRQTGPKLRVGQMAYDAVVVPALHTIRRSTLERLEAFAKAGGAVIFAGEVPTLVDGVASDRPARLARRATAIPLVRTQLLSALEPFREIEVACPSEALGSRCLTQIRRDGKNRHVFVCNIDRQRPRADAVIRLRGTWSPSRLDTFTGKAAPLTARYTAGWTEVPCPLPAHGHALLTFTPGKATLAAPAKTVPWEESARLADPVPVTLAEPNVLLLDQAEYRINEGRWQPREEILRLDNCAREAFGLKPRQNAIAQPWTEAPDETPLGTLTLRFTLDSAVRVERPALALEQAAAVQITLDGAAVESRVTGWWVDEAIHTVALPALEPGRHELLLTLPYRRKTTVEWCYLLGDFGVELRGRHARLTPPVRELAFGDWTRQGLPFYAGNVTYHCPLAGTGQPARLRAHLFKAPLLTIALDGKPLGPIAVAPFEIDLGTLSAGAHTLDITAFGNRINAFGALHNSIPNFKWWGPGAWRTTGSDWTYEYQLRPMGVLAAPAVLQAKKYPLGHAHG